MPIIRRLNCIDAESGIVSLGKWLSNAQFDRVLSQPVHRTAIIVTLGQWLSDAQFERVLSQPVHRTATYRE